MADNYTVYMHRFPNGKVYIGITNQPIKNRWRNGEGYKNQIVYSAIQKYGWDNILHEVLFDGLTKEQAENEEMRLIALYKANKNGYGYNIANGGNCAESISESTRKKIALANKGKTRSEETKKRMSDGIKKAYENPEYVEKKRASQKAAYAREEYKSQLSKRTKKLWESDWYRKKMVSVHKGKVVSEETRRKVSQARLGRFMGAENVNARPVVQYTKDGDYIKTWESAMDAARATGENNAKICECCKGNRKSAGGFRWGYVTI